MTRQQAVKVWALLVAYYPVPAITKEALTLYTDDIVDLDAAAVDEFIKRWRRNETRRPMPAELRRSVVELASEDLLTTAEAWEYVQACFTTVGAYREFPDSYPLVKRAVDTMGWGTLCASENAVADRAHFFRVYDTYRQRGLTQAAVSDGLAAIGSRMKLIEESRNEP